MWLAELLASGRGRVWQGRERPLPQEVVAGGLRVLAGRAAWDSGLGRGGDRAALGNKSSHVHEEAAGDAKPGSASRTYFRHKARGCPGSLSAGPSEARSAKGQASSIMKAASSSRTGKSVSVMAAIWGDTWGCFRSCRQRT